MDNDPQLIRLRTKIFGILLYDARTNFTKKPDDCAIAMGVSPERYHEYESGQIAPSLPEIEALAYYLKIPLTHFWQSQLLSKNSAGFNLLNKDLFQLRCRIIGTLLRKDRMEAQLSISELAQKASIAEEKITQYEEGQLSIPVPELEMLLRAMNLNLQKYYDQNGPVGSWRNQEERSIAFSQLPETLQQFFCQPVNRPYLELAMRLNEVSAEKLRAIAENLLEITF